MLSIEPNTLVLLLVALLNVVTLYMTNRTNRLASETKVLALKTELNTNSMREQLVEQKGLASHAAGLEQGRIEGEAKAATLAEGQKQGAAEA